MLNFEFVKLTRKVQQLSYISWFNTLTLLCEAIVILQHYALHCITMTLTTII